MNYFFSARSEYSGFLTWVENQIRLPDVSGGPQIAEFEGPDAGLVHVGPPVIETVINTLLLVYDIPKKYLSSCRIWLLPEPGRRKCLPSPEIIPAWALQRSVYKTINLGNHHSSDAFFSLCVWHVPVLSLGLDPLDPSLRVQEDGVRGDVVASQHDLESVDLKK